MLILVLSACTISPVPLRQVVDGRCPAGTTLPLHFQVTSREIPGFIEPIVSFAVYQSVLQRGFEPVTGREAQETLDIQLIFELADETETREADPMQESGSGPTLSRFDAIVQVRLSVGPATVAAGSVRRHHAITGGETFHSEQAVLQTRAAFAGLLDELLDGCGPAMP